MKGLAKLAAVVVLPGGALLACESWNAVNVRNDEAAYHRYEEDQLASLRRSVRAKEQRIAELEERLTRLDDSELFREAGALGVSTAVAASQMTEAGQRRVVSAIMRESRGQGIDPLLVVALIQTESSFNAYAVSSVGARGLMQVMPLTARWMLEKKGAALSRDTNLFEPELNIALGVEYLAWQLKRFGSVEHALVAYNAGPNAALAILSDVEKARKFKAGYPATVMTRWRTLQRQASTVRHLASATR